MSFSPRVAALLGVILLISGAASRQALAQAEGTGDEPARLAALRAELAAAPDQAARHIALADALATLPTGIEEAVAEYRAALALEPGNPAARKGLAQTLPFDGNLDEITRLYQGLLEEQPNNIDFLFARARLARLAGDQKLASELLDRGRQLAPDDARLVAESAELNLLADDKTQAASDAALAVAIDPQLPAAQKADAAVDEATERSVGAKIGYNQTSNHLSTTTLAARAEWYPYEDTRLRIEPGFARYEDELDQLNRPTIGAALRQSFAHGIAASGTYRAYFPEGVDMTHEVDAELGWKPFELPLMIALGLRRRSLSDTPPGYEDLADFGRIGSGGGTVASLRQRLQTNEQVLGANATPVPGGYVYAELSRGKLSDGNRQRSTVAGFGYDLFRDVEGYSKQSLVLKYDFYNESFSQPSVNFFASRRFQVHTPGVDWRYRYSDATTLGLEAGYPIQATGDTGFLLGAFASSKVGKQLTLEGRARVIDDSQFRVLSVFVGPKFSF